MAHGTPGSLDEVEAFATRIRRGRPPSPGQLAELVGRYEAIGGTSPLAGRTEAQRAAIAAALERAHPGRFVVATGTKHAEPAIEAAVAGLARAGVGSVVGLVLAPHRSASVDEYHQRAGAAAGGAGLPYDGIASWHLLPAFLDFLAGAVAEASAGLPGRRKVLFSAHSLPERVLVGDPYPDQLWEGASAVAARLGLRPWPDWALCWQSAGRTPEPWRGPDVNDAIRLLAGTGRADAVVVCAHGFVAEHLEVRYDLDVEAAATAAEVGLAFARTPSLDDDPAAMAALAGLVAARAGLGPPPP